MPAAVTYSPQRQAAAHRPAPFPQHRNPLFPCHAMPSVAGTRGDEDSARRHAVLPCAAPTELCSHQSLYVVCNTLVFTWTAQVIVQRGVG